MNKARNLLDFIDEVSILPSGTPGMEQKKRVKEHDFATAMRKYGKGIMKKKEVGGVESYYFKNQRVGYTEKKRGQDKSFYIVSPLERKEPSSKPGTPMPYRKY